MKGKTVAHFRILHELGRGGMGVVYCAEDTKLHRQVALKVLSPHLLSSEDDRARFYREARSAAQLNHANIATVYAVDEVVDEQGQPNPFIAMELIEGRTLREVVDESPLKISEAVRVASEAAAALRLAHQKDIVHRDVKAGNIMVTESGSVKVLDFGLAKTTQSTMLTKTGSTLGTAAYMSPEQAGTGEVDRRSDIWSLGVVLYEMVAGSLPFAADYEQAVVYAILNEDPTPLTSVRTGVPIELERIVTKCLMKDPSLRYQYTDDLIADLRAVELGSTGPHSTTMTVQGGRTRKAGLSRGVLASVTLLLGLAVGALGAWLIMMEGGFGPEPSALPGPTHRLTLKLPESAPFDPVGDAWLGVGQTALDISDDGRRVVYIGRSGSSTRLYVRELDREEVRPLPGTEGAINPFFSPDGEWVAFRSGSALLRVSVNGGQPVEIGDQPEAMGGAWSTSGDIYTTESQGSGLTRISASGGASQPIRVNTTDLRLGELPSLLPGERTILTSRTIGIFSISIEDGAFTLVSEIGTSASYAPSGHLVFALPGRLMAAPFDSDKLEMKGAAVPVVEGVRTEVVRRAAQYAFSKTGTLVYAPGGAADLARLVAVDRSGKAEPLPFDPDYFGTFTLSHDGTRLAISTLGMRAELWVYDLERRQRSKVSSSGSGYPFWTPDGRRLLFWQANEQGGAELIAWHTDGGTTSIVTELELYESPGQVSPDGRQIIYLIRRDGVNRLEMRGIDGDREGEVILESTEHVWGARFSPDGRYISFTSDETGESQVFVMAIDGSDRKWQISVDGGEEALWSQDGRELFFSNGTTWFKVPVSTTPDFSFGPPELLFEGPYLNVPGFGYAVYPDADRFILLESVTGSGPITELKVVENWFAELERLAPTAR
jgi:serine/threonine-protein kinase